MRISRTIGGVSIPIELTKEELIEAYSEQQHLDDKEDISEYFDSMDDDGIFCSYGLARSEIELMLDEMATLKRHYILKRGMSCEDAIEKAISNVIKLKSPAIREARGRSNPTP